MNDRTIRTAWTSRTLRTTRTSRTIRTNDTNERYERSCREESGQGHPREAIRGLSDTYVREDPLAVASPILRQMGSRSGRRRVHWSQSPKRVSQQRLEEYIGVDRRSEYLNNDSKEERSSGEDIDTEKKYGKCCVDFILKYGKAKCMRDSNEIRKKNARLAVDNYRARYRQAKFSERVKCSKIVCLTI